MQGVRIILQDLFCSFSFSNYFDSVTKTLWFLIFYMALFISSFFSVAEFHKKVIQGDQNEKANFSSRCLLQWCPDGVMCGNRWLNCSYYMIEKQRFRTNIKYFLECKIEYIMQKSYSIFFLFFKSVIKISLGLFRLGFLIILKWDLDWKNGVLFSI